MKFIIPIFNFIFKDIHINSLNIKNEGYIYYMTSYLFFHDWINIDKINSSLLSKNPNSIEFFFKILIKLIGIIYLLLKMLLNF